MARKQRFRRRRAIGRIHRRRGSKFTLVNLGKAGIALTPVAVATYEGWKSGGALGAAGAVESAYTGYDFSTKSWKLQNLAVGYVPIIGAILFGKAMRRAGIRL